MVRGPAHVREEIMLFNGVLRYKCIWGNLYKLRSLYFSLYGKVILEPSLDIGFF